MFRVSLGLGGGVATAVTIALAGALGASPAAAAPSAGIDIVSPSPASAVAEKMIPVRLDTGAQVTGVEAFIGNRDVSSRFHRHGRTWTAKLPATLVGNGTRRLLVQALTRHGGGGTASETFVVGRRDPQLLSAVHAGVHDGSSIRVLATSRAATTASLTINGRPVSDIDEKGSRTGHRWELTPRDGLRRGRNRIEVSVLDRHGNIASRRMTVVYTPATLGASSAPVLGEQGLYLSTDLKPGPGSSGNTIYIDGTAYTSTVSGGAAKIFVQLDEKTLAPVASSLDGTELAPKAGTITIAVWEADTVTFTTAENGSRVWIGTKEVADSESTQGCDAGGNCTTNLHGWLLPASGTNPATWTDSDPINVQTRGSGEGTTTNTMQVGGQSYPVDLAAGATGGFELLTLDNTGAPTGEPTAYSFTGDASADLATENQLTQALHNAAGQPVTILLQGFGSLPAIDATGSLAQAITAIGGNADVVSRFGPSQSPDSGGAEYALISGRSTTAKGWQWHGMETSSERTGNGALSALLVRDQTQNDYVPMTGTASTSPLGTASDALLPLIYQAPSSWANWVPDGKGGVRAPSTAEAAAFTDIASKMESNGWVSSTNELCPNAPDPVRGALCNANAPQLTNIADEVTADLQYDQAKGTAGGYDQTDFRTVQTAISEEFSNASTIRGAIDDYQGIFGTSATNGTVNATTIGQAVQKNLRTSTNDTYSFMTSFLGAMTDMFSIVDDPGLAPVLSWSSGAFSYMGLFQPYTGPGNQLADNVEVNQATAAVNLQNTLQNGSDALSIYGDYLASDPVKLMSGAAMLGGTYALSGKTLVDTEHATEYAANQYLWGTLMSAAYNVWTGPATLGSNPTCFYGGSPPTNAEDPFGNADANDQWPSVSGTTLTNWWIAQSVGPANNIGTNDNIALPSKTTDQLTGTINAAAPPTQASNVGAVQPYFDNTYLAKEALPINPRQSPPAYDSGCMPHQF